MERFMELYQTVYQDLYRLAYFYLGNAADAEDTVQETALAAYEHFGRLKNQESFRPWIFRILVNCCRKCWRRRKCRELPIEEIARLLNRNHSTIRSRYRRALKKLEQEVAQGKEMQG